MGRELRRVPVDFSWPLETVWQGFLNPHYDKAETCSHCNGSGDSLEARRLMDVWYGKQPFKPQDRGSQPFTPETAPIRAFAERNVKRAPEYYGPATEASFVREATRLCQLFNSQWSHHLNDDDVKALVQNGRLMEMTHEWTEGEGWKPRAQHVMPTALEVNLWSMSGGLGHDSFNACIVVNAELERQGLSAKCPHCDGEGQHWPSEADKLACESWEREGPPSGEGYQLWETVTEGSPISPVFDTAEGLARWMADNKSGRIDDDTSYEQWLAFIVGPGWAPTMMTMGGAIVPGVVAAAAEHHSEAGLLLPAP